MSQKINALLTWVVGNRSFESQMNDMPNRLAVILNLFAGIVSILYVTVDLIQGYYPPLVTHIILLIGGVTGIVLIRLERIYLAKVLVLTLFNLALYLSVAAETYETGSHLYFFTLAISAFVVFDYKQLGIAIFFAGLSFALYLFATLSSYSLLPEFNFSPVVAKTFFIINVTVFTSLTTLIIVLYIRMIHDRNLKIQEQNKQLRQTNSELDQFLYSTSHDLRAPLASVLGLLNVVEITEDKKEVEKYHELMRSRIQKMDLFIKDIIDIIKNTRLPIQKEHMVIKDLVERTYADLKFQTGAENIKFLNNIPDNIEMDSDRIRITTLFNNLLSNALKYSDPGKDLPNICVEAEENGSFIHFEVRDNGIGIEKDQLDKIFQMFYRATEISKGAGLGLYIATETVRKLNGTIDVESIPRIGTTFKISLPKN